MVILLCMCVSDVCAMSVVTKIQNGMECFACTGSKPNLFHFPTMQLYIVLDSVHVFGSPFMGPRRDLCRSKIMNPMKYMYPY